MTEFMLEAIWAAERHQRLHEIAEKTIEQLTPNGVEWVISFIQAGGGSLFLGLDKVVALIPETASPNERDHLFQVYFSTIESHLYRHGYYSTGRFVEVLANNYKNLVEEQKQSIIRNGFDCVVSSVSNAEELDACTPLKAVTNGEYSALYERLVAAWGGAPQKKVAAEMFKRLATIHDLLPRHKIGDDFRRARRHGWEEPLPLYVRNEIHHPTQDGLPESAKFQRDKRIGYAIMEAWMNPIE